MDTASFRLPEALVTEIGELAKRRGVTRSDVVREAVEAFVRKDASDEKRSRLERLDEVLAGAAGTGITDLAENAKAYLRDSFGQPGADVKPPSKRVARPAKRPAR